MYSVLIVDDERPVIESITYMLQKNRPELQIAGTAVSGREAIQKAEEGKPDIILIDVKMPGIDGLDALREIKRRMPYIMPILMTAYERFDIAQTAFELGVQDYLLKPFSQKKLIAAVDAAVQTLNRNTSGQGESLKHIELLHSLQGTIEQLFFKSVKLDSSLEEFIPFLQTTLSLHSTRGSVGLLTWEVEEDEVPESGFSSCEHSEQRIQHGRTLLSKLKYKFPCLGSVSAKEILFFFPERNGSRSAPTEDHLARIFKRDFNAEDVPRWHFVLGDSVELPRLADSCREARRGASGNRGENSVSDIETKILRSRLPAWRNLSEELALQNKPEDLDWFIETELSAIEDLSVARAVILDLGLNTEHRHRLTTSYSLQVLRSGSLEELCVLCSRWFRQLIEQLVIQRDSSMPPALRRALEYIDVNFSRPIQLSEVALHVEVSPAYLSNLFTRHLGRSFIDQLTDYRIEKAKQLLAEQSYSIKAISHMVGYHDPNYFSRLFKKWTGRPPTEYRM